MNHTEGDGEMVFFGLGNPGTEYHDSKHNLGFQAIDQFVITHRKEILESRFLPMLYHYWSCKDRFGNAYLLIKPLTYMNNSGEAYRRAQKQFGYADGESVIIYDDVALPLGAVRIRARGSDGGHKGIRSILGVAGSQEIARIRIGIGPKPNEMDLSDYVLRPLRASERSVIAETIDVVTDAMERLTYERVEIVMNQINRLSKEKYGSL
ncbi:MAG TPA: aminoacyl-tRNA hydrolase [Thermotogota bacterium]|nr:aminoacyl-tRNA hydrolase [Thermotogota bacterium]HQN22064.1 aminoacyl-tRNA hydrolase [Thermotogota bacterium]